MNIGVLASHEATTLQSLIDACDLVFLAGYMKRVGPLVLAAFKGRVLNTHPALLPKFGGKGIRRHGDARVKSLLSSRSMCSSFR